MAQRRNIGTGIAAIAVLMAITVTGAHAATAMALGIRADLAAGNPEPAPPIVVTAAPAGQPYRLTIRECNDGGTGFPCVAVEGSAGQAWSLVWSVDRSVPLGPCDTVTGGPVSPCLGDWSVPASEWLVFAESVTVGGTR